MGPGKIFKLLVWTTVVLAIVGSLGCSETQKRDQKIHELILELRKNSNGDEASEKTMVVLEKIGVPAIAPLIAVLNDDDPAVSVLAETVLSRIGTPAVEPLIAALNDKNAQGRDYAAMALGDVGDGRAVEPLIAALRDKDVGVRVSAAEAEQR